MAKEVKKGQKKKKEEIKEEVHVEEVKSTKKDDTKEISSKNKKEMANEALKTIDDNRMPIILFIAGFLIATLVFRCILWPDRIATLKDGTQPVATVGKKTITADDLYASMKKRFSVSYLLDDVDNIILTKMYPSDDKMETEIKDTAEYWYTQYEQYYGYTKEEFLSKNGFSGEDDFLDYLRLEYRKKAYYDDYALDLVTDSEIEKYYKDDVFGDVDSKHILVATGDDGLSDDEAKKLAKEIISKLDKGTTWDDVIKEYKDQIVSEELGYNAFNASLESAYLKECKNLEVGTYSKTPVLTSYGYHIVYKIAQKDKPKLEDVKDDIKDILAEQKKNADTDLYSKALVSMRKDAKLEFVDTKFKEEYEKLVNSYK